MTSASIARPRAPRNVSRFTTVRSPTFTSVSTVVNVEPPHQMSFKCTPEGFADLIEREGIIPAPYLARAMWVQESELGTVLERRELEGLLRTSYELVVAKLPGSKRPGGTPTGQPKKRSGASKAKPKARANAKPRARVKGR
jgi:predicted DNA-binding protein (MmcQ/YjbR family)